MVTSYKGEKVSKDAKSIFQRGFQWRRRCRIVSNDADSNETIKKKNRFNKQNNNFARA